MSRRKILCIICIAAMTLSLLAGCGGSGAASKGATAAGKDSATIALWEEPTTLCSMKSPQSVTQLISRQICEPLVLTDETGINVTPLLATKWEISTDGKEILFTLRDDVNFSNGQKMTADDVVFSYEENLRLGIEETVITDYDHMEKVDDTHVRLFLKHPYGAIMTCIGASDCGIVCKSAYEADPAAFERAPVGTGPYKASEWRSGESISLAANDKYWGGAPAIKNVTFKLFSDNNAASLALQNGEIDVCLNPPAIDKSRIEGSKGLTWLSGTGLNNDWIYFGYKEGSHFTDENVRLAVAYAIDKDAVTKGATDGLGIPSYGSIYGDQWGYTPPGYKSPQNDLEMAKQYMAKSAYPDGFDVEVVTSNNPSYYKSWEIVQPMLAEIGINITIKKIDPGTWNSDVFWTGNYEMNGWLCDMSFPDFDDSVPLWRTGAFLNAAGMSVPYLDKLMDDQDVAANNDQRLEMIRTINQYLCDHAYVVPLYTYPNFAAFNSNLKGITVGTMISNYKIYQWSWAN
jgi:peptide/nickel transport system substrate-binding protein